MNPITVTNDHVVLFNQVQVPVLIIEKTDSSILFANNAACKLFESDTQSILNQPIGVWIDSDLSITTLFNENQHFEGHLKPKQRSFKTISMETTPCEYGGKNGFLIHINDVSNWTRPLAQLQASEDKFRAMFEHFSEGIYQVDSKGTFLEVNQALVRMLGYRTKQDLYNLNYMTGFYMSPQDLVEVTKMAHATAGRQYIDAKLKMSNGEALEVKLKPRVVQDDNGANKYYEVMVIDKTELHSSELANKALEEQLAYSKRLESLGTMAGGIAHDFNNILSTIMMATESLSTLAKDDERLLKYINIITSSSERGAAISKQLLLFSKQDSMELQPIRPSQLMDEMVELFKHTFPADLRIVSLSEREDLNILGNYGQLQQVLMHLAENSKDAIQEKQQQNPEMKGELLFSLERIAAEDILVEYTQARPVDYLKLQVQDNGMGIKPDILERIMEPFFTTKSHGKGTGLGMPIVHGIIKAHNGFLDVSSREKEGTTVSIYIPIASQENQTIDTAPHLLQTPTHATILIVDDEELLRETFSELLEAAGFHIITAKDGLDALEVFEKNKEKINLIVTDMSMPNMNGEELFKKLINEHPSAKVIFSTGYLEPGIQEELMKKGAKGIIFKPFKITELLKTIREVLAQDK